MGKEDLIREGYIPLDKSWIIRLGVQDLLRGYDDCIKYLRQNRNLGDDLLALYDSSRQWTTEGPVHVRESGTLYRFLRFASWKLGKKKDFILAGTLRNRNVCNNPEIVDWSLEKLLTLDDGTSQWASASVLFGNQQRIENPPYNLQVTYDAVEHWKVARAIGKRWTPRYDETIAAQASAYKEWQKEGKMNFIPRQAEDYCFARALGIMSAEEGEKRWPSLRSHESDRISEMEQALGQDEVTSQDHRVVQAVAMLKRGKVRIKYPDAVHKSWPQFWKFLKDC